MDGVVTELTIFEEKCKKFSVHDAQVYLPNYLIAANAWLAKMENSKKWSEKSTIPTLALYSASTKEQDAEADIIARLKAQCVKHRMYVFDQFFCH